MSAAATSVRPISAEPEVVVGLFGVPPAVARMQRVGDDLVADGLRGVRFVSGAHPDPGEGPERITRLADRIDSALFIGPLYHDLTMDALGGHLPVPATFVPLSSGSLYAALLRASIDGRDVERVSIDSHSTESVKVAYNDVDLTSDAVHVLPYRDPSSVADFEAFHRELLRSGQVSLALTTVGRVQRSLSDDGLLVRRIEPTRATLRRSVETAVLLARGARLGGQQIAFCLVQLASVDSSLTLPYWQEEAAVRVQALLLELSRSVGATVVRRSPLQFGVTATVAGLEQLTDGLRHAPFIDEVRSRLGITVAVGIGTGHTPIAAVNNAGAALESSMAAADDTAAFIDTVGTIHRLTQSATPRSGRATQEPERELFVLAVARLNQGHTTGESVVVGVEEVAAALGVTPRSGQRTLKALVEAGLAWPVPAETTPQGGRPRRLVRLVPTPDAPNRQPEPVRH